ncbi:PREDICTED: protein PLANT CADMIUM RESISTANCE 2-like isoform X1 [Nelumbo nucifera]|uniref:Protein PLANT CADMIUM RESISTANCE 2-like isoform X1 n=1 Tax=Nelumbo nucifera TaxID=4432 RepID=A0A1U8B5Y8_NELNU|nr:PREDICTED: protein PLANT CADMIUM RESISTANCE 2-like isoform X1 [Nelumbo nucifera]
MYSTNNVQNYPAAIPVYSQPNNVQNYPAEIPVYSLPAQFPPNISQQNPLNVIPIHSQAQYPWSSGLFDCFNDCESCCLTLWCPCITFGRIAEIVSKGSSSCVGSASLYTLIWVLLGCPWIYSCTYRSMLRQQFSLQETPCADCLVHCCCDCCALCQEYRELKQRGFSMAQGWSGNMQNQNRGVTMAPVVQGGMIR